VKRKALDIFGRKVSYLDNEKGGVPLVCLHGHYGTGSVFSFLENYYKDRLILLDQRGHGFSDHTVSYTRDDYFSDLETMIDKLGISNFILLGHSLGGINAIQFASRKKDVVRLIVEDIGTEVPHPRKFFDNFPKYFRSVAEVNEEFQKRGRPLSTYFMESLTYDGVNWSFRFSYDDIFQSESSLAGDYWNEWERIGIPTLLLHGGKTWACKTENLVEMEKRNRNSRLICYENAGHSIQDDVRNEFVRDLIQFVESPI